MGFDPPVFSAAAKPGVSTLQQWAAAAAPSRLTLNKGFSTGIPDIFEPFCQFAHPICYGVCVRAWVCVDREKADNLPHFVFSVKNTFLDVEDANPFGRMLNLEIPACHRHLCMAVFREKIIAAPTAELEVAATTVELEVLRE